MFCFFNSICVLFFIFFISTKGVFMNTGRLSPNTTNEINAALFSPESQLEYDRLDAALTAISENSKVRTRKLGDLGGRLIDTIQNTQGRKKMLPADQRESFKNEVISYVRANLGDRPEQSEDSLDKKEPRSFKRKSEADERVPNVERRESKKAESTQRKLEIVHDKTDTKSLKALKAFLDPLSPSLKLNYWNQAENRLANPEVLEVYGRAFFDGSPSLEEIEEARSMGLDLSQFRLEVSQIERESSRFFPIFRAVDRIFDINCNEDFYLISREGAIQVLRALESVVRGVEVEEDRSIELKIKREIAEVTKDLPVEKHKEITKNILQKVQDLVLTHCQNEKISLVLPGLNIKSPEDILEAWTDSCLSNEPRILTNWYGKAFFKASPSSKLVNQIIEEGVIDVRLFKKEISKYAIASKAMRESKKISEISGEEKSDSLERAHARAVNMILMNNFYNSHFLRTALGTEVVLYALECISAGVQMSENLLTPFESKLELYAPLVKKLISRATTAEERNRLSSIGYTILSKGALRSDFLNKREVFQRGRSIQSEIYQEIQKAAQETAGGLSPEEFLKFKKRVVKNTEDLIVEHSKEKGFSLVEPSIELAPAHEIAMHWIKADLLRQPDSIVNQYGRAFFDSNPPGELVAEIYNVPINLVGFGADLDRYQEYLAPFGRLHSQDKDGDDLLV
jgi:hypothetical protein